MCHTLNRAVEELKNIVGYKIVLKVSRHGSARLLCVTSVKGRMFKNKFYAVDNLERNITSKIAAVPATLLTAVFVKMECLFCLFL
jgi:hypothetical protein